MDEFERWWRGLSADEKREAAEAADVTIGHLNNVAGGSRVISPELAAALERHTQAALVAERLCPLETWRRVADTTWPHPAGKPLLDVAPEAA